MPLNLEETISRCDQIAQTTLDESRIPKDLFPKNYELTTGVKLLLINSFLTVLANAGDITDTEFRTLLVRYRITLDNLKKGE